jgi:hypothetical protein
VREVLRAVLERLRPSSRALTAQGSRFFIKEGYVSRAEPVYFDDLGGEELGILPQPLVYPFAGHMSTPERDLVRGPDDLGPPGNPHHVREWNLAELERLLTWAGLQVLFIGLTASNDDGYPKAHDARRPRGRDRSCSGARTSAGGLSCRCVRPDLQRGRRDRGIDRRARRRRDRRVRDRQLVDRRDEVDRGVPSRSRGHRRGALSRFGTDVCLRLGVDHPADGGLGADPRSRLVHSRRRRRTPATSWQDGSLRDAVYAVDRCGFNCIDHTVLEFLPVDEGFRDGDDVEEYFRHFRFGSRPGHFLQVKAWKNLGQRVDRVTSYGHDTEFPERRPFPYKFLTKHYPFRSTEHGRRKVFMERLPRYPPNAVAQGVHLHYQALKPEHAFVRPECELHRFDEATFNREFLVERLAGVGVRPELA